MAIATEELLCLKVRSAKSLRRKAGDSRLVDLNVSAEGSMGVQFEVIVDPPIYRFATW